MRLALAALGVTVAAAGCFAPFSWPADRAPTGVPPAPVITPPAAGGDAALGRAADCLDGGDEIGAVPHLREYVAANPDAGLTRAHLAELLFKHGDPAGAKAEFERVLADAPEAGPIARHRAHCHTRLMALAETAGDAFAEHLHRGVGLLLLVEKWDADPATADAVLAEQTCAKAVSALRTARDERPADARVNLYLSVAYARLGQPGAAAEALRHARTGLPDDRLTAAERARVLAGVS